MYETILTPVDGSDEAFKAAKHAVDLAANHGATLHVLYVIESKPAYTGVGLSGLQDETVMEEYKKFAEEQVARVAAFAEENDVECVTDIKTGVPHSKIVEYAETNGVDAIAMGAHGYDWDGIADKILGSTTERVNRNATVPVITVR